MTLNKVTIYPMKAYNGFWVVYWERKETAWLSKIREVTDEELDKIRNWTRTEVSRILEEKYFIDDDTDEVWRVHFKISKKEDILRNND